MKEQIDPVGDELVGGSVKIERPQISEKGLRLLNLNPNDIGPLLINLCTVEDLIPGIDIQDLNSLDNLSQPPNVPVDSRTESGRDQDVSFSSSFQNYLTYLKNERPEKLEELKSYFKDKVIIDLGAGTFPTGYMVANLLGAKGYIGVEPYNWRELMTHFLSKKLSPDYFKTKFNFIVEDAVTFLRRLPPESVCILSSGLADGITSSDNSYEVELENEIDRVLPEGGICMVSNSIAPRKLFNKEHTLLKPENGSFKTKGSILYWSFISF